MRPSRFSRTITFSLPAAMFEQLQDIRGEEGRVMSDLVREALRLYIEERELRRQERLQRLRSRQIAYEANIDEESIGDPDTLVAEGPYAWGYGEGQGIDVPDGAVLVRGMDFTSRPTRRKPILCVECLLVGDVLHLAGINPWRRLKDFDEFESFLSDPSPAGLPWIAGIDFPFGMPLMFIENMKWPGKWADYVATEVESLTRDAWREVLDSYKRDRPMGDKEHLRATDAIAGSLSPQKLYGIPVALMFFEGAPRLRRVGVMIPGLQEEGSPERVVVEAYPGVAVRNLLGEKPSYKSDIKARQTAARLEARRAILEALTKTGAVGPYSIKVQGIEEHRVLLEDGTGDHLDALLCAVQAAWAYRNGPPDFGMPAPICPTEGCIADPAMKAGF